MQTQIIVNESCSTIRYLARQALKDRWVMASVAVLIFSACIEVPPMFINVIFDTSSNLNQLMSGQMQVGDGLMGAMEEIMKTTGYISPSSFIYTLLVSGPFTFGITLYFINMVRRNQVDYGQIFGGFSYFGRTLGLSVLLSLISLAFAIPFFVLFFIGMITLNLPLLILSILSLLLLLIPAIMFSMCYFLMVDNVQIGVVGAIGVSWNLMRGNGGKFFLLNLSFIGWFIVGGLILNVVISLFSIGGSPFLIAVGGFIGQAGIFVVTAYVLAAQVQFYDLLTGRLRLGNPSHLSGGY